jgi:hypothetical protein
MPNYQPYSPGQAELLPAHVKDVLGADHLCFLVHEVVESLDLSSFEDQEEDAGSEPMIRD